MGIKPRSEIRLREVRDNWYFSDNGRLYIKIPDTTIRKKGRCNAYNLMDNKFVRLREDLLVRAYPNATLLDYINNCL